MEDNLDTSKEVPSTENKNLEFSKVINLLQTTHNLSTTKICEYLKTYRPWVTKYILPFLDKIYLPTGRNYQENKNSKKMSNINWPYLLFHRGVISSLESSWYSKEDFQKLLDKSLISITRKTISISITYLIAKNKRDNYKKEYKQLSEQRQKLLEANQWNEIKNINQKLNELLSMYVDDYIYDAIKNCDETKRTQIQEVSVPNCEWNYEKMLAIHDLKGYGGIDETIYRKLFKKGAVRLEFSFTSKKNEKGKKIFYYYDPKDKQYDLNDEMPLVTLPYDFFLSKIRPR